MKRYNVHNMIRLRPITKPNDFGLKWRCKVYFDGATTSRCFKERKEALLWAKDLAECPPIILTRDMITDGGRYDTGSE
jgi:hypothetical protein